MDSVKFFDNNGVELCEGDFIYSQMGKTRIDYFVVNRLSNGKLTALAHSKEFGLSFPLRDIRKHTPKLIKIKRTFEEVCELRDSGALFKYNGRKAEEYKPVVAKTESKVFVDNYCVSMWQFKPKNSDTWQELEFKEVEE